ncbi:hypothetical protein NDU88_007105 [Pleurodeles waltl]|uniref:Uncharacterized protein n=1 Tax=Pleurodeles waltl TaxID=8319 RepID=A0AAV7TZQ6_PLEWA|nr:hypothetical protein NDU88_007105 [Pleurodeles waltl]
MLLINIRSTLAKNVVKGNVQRVAVGERTVACGADIASWELWLDLFEAYVDVLEESECSPERHLSLIKHRLGVVGLREFKNLPPVENVNAEDVYKCALKQLQERGKMCGVARGSNVIDEHSIHLSQECGERECLEGGGWRKDIGVRGGHRFCRNQRSQRFLL